MVELAKNTTKTTDVELGDNISFGENDADSMQGSLTFPSLKIDTESFLPQQVDDHNCGMAVIAATGIILRDLFGLFYRSPKMGKVPRCYSVGDSELQALYTLCL